MVLSPSRVEECTFIRTSQLLRDGDDAVAVTMCLEGGGEIRSGDDTAVLRPGQAIMLPYYRTGCATWLSGSRLLTLRIEGDVARRIAPSMEAAFLRTTTTADPSFALLMGYCSQLTRLPGALPGATGALAGAQIEELTAHRLRQHNAPEHAGGSGLRAARLAAIKNDIAGNLDRRDLSTAALAARHRLTERQLQRLFEREGTTVTEYREIAP